MINAVLVVIQRMKRNAALQFLRRVAHQKPRAHRFQHFRVVIVIPERHGVCQGYVLPSQSH